MMMTSNSLLLVVPCPTSHYIRKSYRENASQPLHASIHALLVVIIPLLNPSTTVTDPGLPVNFPISILRLKAHCSSADGAPNNMAIQAMGFSALRILSAGFSSRTKLVWYLYAPWAYFWLITDFKNPSDPNDISFEVHPENYPVAELEYPNTGAKERFVSSQDALLALSSHVSGSFFSHLKTRTTIIRSWILKSPCWQLWSVSLPSSCCFITWESLLFRLLYPRTASPVWTAAAWIVSRHKWISSIFTIAIFFYIFFVLYTSHRHLLGPGRGSSTSNNNPRSSTPHLQTSN